MDSIIIQHPFDVVSMVRNIHDWDFRDLLDSLLTIVNCGHNATLVLNYSLYQAVISLGPFVCMSQSNRGSLTILGFLILLPQFVSFSHYESAYTRGSLGIQIVHH